MGAPVERLTLTPTYLVQNNLQLLLGLLSNPRLGLPSLTGLLDFGLGDCVRALCFQERLACLVLIPAAFAQAQAVETLAEKESEIARFRSARGRGRCVVEDPRTSRAWRTLPALFPASPSPYSAQRPSARTRKECLFDSSSSPWSGRRAPETAQRSRLRRTVALPCCAAGTARVDGCSTQIVPNKAISKRHGTRSLTALTGPTKEPAAFSCADASASRDTKICRHACATVVF